MGAHVEEHTWTRYEKELRAFFLNIRQNPGKIATDRVKTYISDITDEGNRTDLIDALEFLYSTVISPGSEDSQQKLHIIHSAHKSSKNSYATIAYHPKGLFGRNSTLPY